MGGSIKKNDGVPNAQGVAAGAVNISGGPNGGSTIGGGGNNPPGG